MLVSVIAAMAHNKVIGEGGKLPWHLSTDLARFRRHTMGKAIILGRKTLEGIGHPLGGRCNIVLTRSRSWTWPGCCVAHSIVEAIERAKEWARTHEQAEIMIAGGGEVYAAALPYCERLYLTIIQRAFQGDTHFPHGYFEREWNLSKEEYFPQDERNPIAHTFIQLDAPRKLQDWLTSEPSAVLHPGVPLG